MAPGSATLVSRRGPAHLAGAALAIGQFDELRSQNGCESTCACSYLRPRPNSTKSDSKSPRPASPAAGL